MACVFITCETMSTSNEGLISVPCLHLRQRHVSNSLNIVSVQSIDKTMERTSVVVFFPEPNLASYGPIGDRLGFKMLQGASRGLQETN